MRNNDVIRRVRYALKINNRNLIHVFQLGGLTISEEELEGLLKREEEEGAVNCNNKTLDAFLTGLITYKRGKLDPSKSPANVDTLSNNAKNVNNYVLKKLRIALAFRSEDMLEAFKLGGVKISESELSALFRKPDHKNYRECGDKFVRVFIKGLVAMFRGDEE
ncbi:DUF1456 family protein [Cetobacterium sp. SF1]|uniref:DUF1456 family protein n=1 Tax=unclassified Cetobacterium TaxID=2630983 RepID=UPI003CF99856